MGHRADHGTVLRRSVHAVSPVVDTILVVAMTVILAATLYVAVSGIFAPISVVSLVEDLRLTEPMTDLGYAADGAVYVSSGRPAIGAGDRVLLDTARHPAHFDVMTSDETAVLFRGCLV